MAYVAYYLCGEENNMIDLLVLNYNDYDTTVKLVSSVVNYSTISHILVVDNCSTDDSYINLLKINNSKIDVIRANYNGGYGAGNNLGINYLFDKYKSKYILLANPDVSINESSILKMEKFLESNPNYVAVAPHMCDKNGRRQANAGWNIPKKSSYILSMSIVGAFLIHPGSVDWDNHLGKNYIDVDAISGSLFMMNSQLMMNNGMYDENVFLYCEETILGFKFKKAGLKSAILTDDEYIHHHSVSISKTYKTELSKRKLILKSRHYVLKNYYNASIIECLLARFFEGVSLLEVIIISKYRK